MATNEPLMTEEQKKLAEQQNQFLNSTSKAVAGMNPDPTEQMIDKAYNTKYLDDWYNDVVGQKNDYATKSKEQNKKNEKAAFWGGVTEAVSSLINVAGTAAGAAPMKWDSPQPKWADKIDSYKVAQQKKLDEYDEMMRKISLQKGELTRQKELAKAGYKERKRNQAIAQQKADAAERKADAQAALYYARVELTGYQSQLAEAKANGAKKQIEVLEEKINEIQARIKKLTADANLSNAKADALKNGDDKPNKPGTTLYDSL